VQLEFGGRVFNFGGGRDSGDWKIAVERDGSDDYGGDGDDSDRRIYPASSCALSALWMAGDCLRCRSGVVDVSRRRAGGDFFYSDCLVGLHFDCGCGGVFCDGALAAVHCAVGTFADGGAFDSAVADFRSLQFEIAELDLRGCS